MLVWIAGPNANQPVSPLPYVDASGNQYPPNLEAIWTPDELAAINMKSVTPAAPAPTAAQLAAQGEATAIAAGIAIISTSTPALNGTYAIDSNMQALLNSEMISIAVNGTFTNQQASRAWPDASGSFHVFTVAQFKTFATAIGLLVDEIIATAATLSAGGSASWPNDTSAIP